jgi:hypothetical protein
MRRGKGQGGGGALACARSYGRETRRGKGRGGTWLMRKTSCSRSSGRVAAMRLSSAITCAPPKAPRWRTGHGLYKHRAAESSWVSSV